MITGRFESPVTTQELFFRKMRFFDIPLEKGLLSFCQLYENLSARTNEVSGREESVFRRIGMGIGDQLGTQWRTIQTFVSSGYSKHSTPPKS